MTRKTKQNYKMILRLQNLKYLAMKILANIKKCANLQLDLKLIVFWLILNFFTPVLVERVSIFMMVKMT